MTSFDELAAARKSWIQDVLRPWCQLASRRELLKAELDWIDIAGKVAPEKTLWLWAWSRFPTLVHENLGIEETSEIQIELRDGRKFEGFPDSRKSQQGNLVIWGQIEAKNSPEDLGPFSIDDIVTVQKPTADGNS